MEKKYNRMKILKKAEYYISPKGRRDIKVLCLCDCGNKKIVRLCHLRSGYTKSCGCLKIESSIINQKKAVKIGKNNGSYIHGMKHDRFYIIWSNMKKRCLNKKELNYKDYGGRGIKFDNKWNNFLNFKKDMYDSYLIHSKEFGEKNTSIDRINNNSNYSKKNCKWSTRQEQSVNKRNNIYLEFNGVKKLRLEWAKELGISPKLLKDRIDKLGWSIEKSLTIPKLNNKTRLLYNYK